MDRKSIPTRHPPPAIASVTPAIDPVAAIRSTETMGQASEARVPSALIKSALVKPFKSAAVETTASAVWSSVAEVWLAERSSEQYSSCDASQSRSPPWTGSFFACLLHGPLPCVAPAAHPSCQIVLGNFARTEEASRRGSLLTQSVSGAGSKNSWLIPDQTPLTEPSIGATQRPGDLYERGSATVAPCSH